MNVSAIIVTRGDVDMGPIFDSLWETGFRNIIVWDNSGERSTIDPYLHFVGGEDLAVYGRYAAIKYARHDLIYVQDDDCVVSDPKAIVDAWLDHPWDDFVVCNMPQEFRHSFYEEHALVGFGACFHRDAPERAFQRWGAATMKRGGALEGRTTFVDEGRWSPFFLRTCDIVFTALTPRALVDVPVQNLPWAVSENRMYRQLEHVAERSWMLDLVKGVRDA